MSKRGKVYLVGAGPGAPDLITVRGLQLLREADVVVSDALIPEELLNEIKAGAELIDAGKRSGHHQLKQEQINRLLVRKACQGHVIVRLKGGDPFLFGRGGEEAQALAAAKIRYEVIPGVSSFTAAPAAAGIPLTHRDFNSSVTIATGHGESQQDWPSLAQQEALILLMGVKSLRRNMKQLIDHGMAPSTPAAAIAWGTLPQQKTVMGTVQTLAAKVKVAKLGAPAVIVVGKIARLREQLKWSEKKPLFARHVLVTRARHQAGELSERLRQIGARVTEIPTIELRAPRSWRTLDRAIKQLADYQWLIVTSGNGVSTFFARLYELGLDARALGHMRIAVIGPATAQRLAEYGVTADVVAESYQAEGLLAKLSDHLMGDEAVLIPRAAEARSILPDELKRWGARVTVAPCYQAVIPSGSRTELKRLMRDDPPDLLSFASSSMVDNFATILKTDAKLWRRARQIPTACIGPITAESARKNKLNIAIQPKQFTIPDLVSAIERYCQRM